MDTRTQIRKYGGSLFVPLPFLYAKNLGINEGDYIVIRDDKGKHGEFMRVWRSKDQTPEKETKKIQPKEEKVIDEVVEDHSD